SATVLRPENAPCSSDNIVASSRSILRISKGDTQQFDCCSAVLQIPVRTAVLGPENRSAFADRGPVSGVSEGDAIKRIALGQRFLPIPLRPGVRSHASQGEG